MNEADFRKLFDSYKNRVFGYVFAITRSHHQAEEITQELFIKLWLSRDLLSEVKNMDNYLFVMARHRTINYLRKMLTDEKALQQLSKLMSTATETAEDRLIEHEYQNWLNKVIDQLSPQRKQVYQLSRVEGLSYNEIAARLGISRNTVKNHLVEAIRQIREKLSEHGIGILLFFTVQAG